MKSNKHILGGNILRLGVMLLFTFCGIAPASPLRLTVQPKGTNQVELTFGPVMPDVYYQVLARTNGPEGHWITFAGYIGDSNKTISATCDLGGIQGLTLKNLNHWRFVVGRWDDPLGDELPPLYKELVLRIDPFLPGDPYANLMGDGWVNIQKLQNNMDPFKWYPPAAPQLSVKFQPRTNDFRFGSAILTWQPPSGTQPDYFLIARTIRTMRSMTNDLAGRQGANFPANYPHMRARPGWRGEDPWVEGPTQVVARVPSQRGLDVYHYIDTNVDTLYPPVYQLQAHCPPPLHACLNRVDSGEIRKTIISVSAQPTTNGYVLTVPQPIPHAWYVLLVRDKNNPQWRASGYFASGTNRDPVYLHVDQKGMMSEDQRPIAMPEVQFQPNVLAPEFVAGWGEDSDGDGLPDIYEILVTRTEPDNADTGNTGILDGFKEMTNDGWSNLEKFRRRIDPLQPAHPPATVELKQPTGVEILKAVTPPTDLGCELQIEVRTNGATNYQPMEEVPWLLPRLLGFRQPNDRRNFDLRVSWRFVEIEPHQSRSNPIYDTPAAYQAIEILMKKIGLQMAEAFKANLATNPPLSRNETSNRMAAIEHSYRQGEMDKGVAMTEIMALQDNQSQDFYGKVVDQSGQPVAGADVKAEASLLSGRGSTEKTETDAAGLFQFTGMRGRSLNIVPEKKGFQIEGHGLGVKGLDGPETSPTNRAVYTMWKLKGSEPMIHDRKLYRVKSDDRIYTIDLLSKKMVEGTNDAGDLLVQFKRPPPIKPREDFEWTFTMTAIGGGLIEVTNDDYLNEAPANGYQPQYMFSKTPENPKRRGGNGEATFYLRSRGGKVHGHFHVRIDPVSRDGASLEIESFVNPSGSRNLEFDPSK